MQSDEHMFMVAIDPLAAEYNVQRLTDLFRSDSMFKGWWHHIPGCFLVTSSSSANELTDKIMTVSGGARLLVARMRPEEAEGHLPPRSWEWISRREADHAKQDQS